MPIHDFLNKKTGKKLSVYVPIKAPLIEHQKQIVDGEEYERTYDDAPLIAKDMQHDDGSFNDFRKTTDGKNVKMGDLYNISKEMSEKRASKNGGYDPVQEKWFSEYEKKFNKKHPEVKKREEREKIREKYGVRIED